MRPILFEMKPVPIRKFHGKILKSCLACGRILNKTGGAMGVTLLEMIIVTAIVSILGALLFPGLKKCRDSAREIRCLHNLRQIGLALSQYCSENEGNCPQIYNTSAWTSWAAVLYDQGYSKDKRVFLCPSSKTSDNWKGSNNTYGFQWWYQKSAPPGYWGPNLNDFQNPANVGLIYDSATILNGTDVTAMACYVYPKFVAADPKQIVRYHNDRANVLFADFHVEGANEIRLRALDCSITYSVKY